MQMPPVGAVSNRAYQAVPVQQLWAGTVRVRAYKARLPNQDAIPILRE